MSSTNSSFARKSCACRSVAFLEVFISWSADSTVPYAPVSHTHFPLASLAFTCNIPATLRWTSLIWNKVSKVKAEVVLGVPGRLKPRIFSTFGTTRVVGRQTNAPAAFTPGEIPGTHFQRPSRHQGTWFCRKKPRKKSQVTPSETDPGTVRQVAQRLNHYATPGPDMK
jgi:hypothetical protein